MSETVYVQSRSREGAQMLLDIACKSGELIPVLEPRPVLGRDNRWEARAALADAPAPPPRRATSRLEYQIRRGHR
jgi:hypothetical protein